MSLFERVRRPTREFVEPTEAAPIIKQFGDYRRYPYAEMMLPRSSLERPRDASAIPICMWAKLPYAA